MHVPDGFLDAQTSVATGVAAVALVAAATRASRDELQESGAALAGLTGVFVFAAQMINFPVGAGTSGHLLGGTLAAVLVGPWTALLAMTVVLGVQALFFADGGLSALGTNVILMAVVPVLVGYGLAKVLARFAGGRPALLAAAAGIGAFVAVPS
ncbi:MAG: cobalamin biosynthesis protein CbiM, partial [Micrococcales bacterium]